MEVRLRAVEWNDIDLLFEWENDFEVWKVTGTLTPFSRHTLEQYVLTTQKEDLYSSRQLRMMIDTDNQGRSKTIGCVDLFDFEPQYHRAGVGILIDKQERAKGFGEATIQAIKRYAFEVLHLHQLHCSIPLSNEHSLRLFSSCDFHKVGEMQDWILHHGRWEGVSFLQCFNPIGDKNMITDENK